MLPRRRFAAASLVGLAALLAADLAAASRGQASGSPDAARVRGIVVERETGRPIAGARIFELPRMRATLIGLREVAVSASDGSFELPLGATSDAMEGGEHLVRASGRSPATFERDALGRSPAVALGEAAKVELRIRTVDALREHLRAVIEVQRTLLDGQDRPSPNGGLASWSQPLGADGSAVFDELPAGVELRLRLTAFNAKRAPPHESMMLAPGSSRVRELVLESKSEVEGRLYRVDGHSGVPHHEVWLARYRVGESLSRQPDAPLATTCTDAEGRFSFADLEPGVWVVATPPLERLFEVDPTSRDHASAMAELVAVFGDGRPAGGWLRARDVGYLVRGRVLDPDGSPVAGATVRVWPRFGRGGADPISGPDGTFVAGPIEPPPSESRGICRLAAVPPAGAWTSSAELQLDGPADGRVLRLRRPASVSGEVLEPDGEPARFLYVDVVPSRRDALASEDLEWTRDGARFEVRRLLAEKRWIRATSLDRTRTALSPALDLAEGEAREGVRVVLRPTAHLALRLARLDPPGQRIQVEVDGALLETIDLHARGPWNDWGSIPLPAGRVRVLISKDPDPVRASEAKVAAEFDVAPGETREIELP